ncbi:CBS domain-containing protein [Natrialbaceae archaeon AArc-T1-2]|uniref:CBS domain-containing protein n=1 Tax=Natrialbaceae archaeon AArc-T1-2 TaxID=3053904 RepID=UPI00255ABC46|nr:CBS domain-containing protein [Natrialbaceae archaeon AArc-T1-2]WIV66624.1 CBS domain-containing protein [Natrialbaceae archaeon AArc-T1-2]
MDISNAVSTEYLDFTHDTPVSKLRGAFEDPSVRGVLVHNEGEFKGVVTRRQLTRTHHLPEKKVGSLVWPVPRVTPEEDVREVAQLMIDSDSRLLPVFEGEQLRGVVTADALLEEVQSYLDAATVGQASSRDLLTVEPDATFGKALSVMRDNRLIHLPVVDDDEAVGMLSLHDLTDLAVRDVTKSQGGNPPGFDGHGGEGSREGYNATGGYGAREGELARMLELPVRDVMATPVGTVRPDRTLETAVHEMFDIGSSSLVVESADGRPQGIVTKTDVLESLTWSAESTRAVQLFGADLFDDMTYDEVLEMIDAIDDMDSDMDVLDAKIHLHEHDEKLRGTSLLLARIRLYTDNGTFIASGEGYGASHAIHEARDVLKRRIREEKTYGRSKKHPDEEFWEKRFGWRLEE